MTWRLVRVNLIADVRINDCHEVTQLELVARSSYNVTINQRRPHCVYINKRLACKLLHQKWLRDFDIK